MKVIAQMDEDRFVVVAEKRELANVMGFGWANENNCPQIKVGSTIKVTEAYGVLHDIRMLKANLKGIADAAEKIGEVIKLKRGFIDPIVEQAEKRSQ